MNTTLDRLNEALEEANIIQESYMCVSAKKSEIKGKIFLRTIRFKEVQKGSFIRNYTLKKYAFGKTVNQTKIRIWD